MLVYSRDALAGPLAELSEIIDKISLGEFNPDETRSGRWPGFEVRRSKQELPWPKGDEPLAPAGQEAAESSISSGSSDAESSSSDELPAGSRRRLVVVSSAVDLPSSAVDLLSTDPRRQAWSDPRPQAWSDPLLELELPPPVEPRLGGGSCSSHWLSL